MPWEREGLQRAEDGTRGSKVSTGGQKRSKMSLRVRLEPEGKGLECQVKMSQQKCFKRERHVVRAIFEKDYLGR